MLICKTLRRDGSSGKVAWAPNKTGKKRVVPLTPQFLETLLEHQCQMQEQGLYEKQGLVFLYTDTFINVYDHLLGRVWHRSFKRCGLPPRWLYAQLYSYISHAVAMGNSPADLAQIAGHSTEFF